MKKLHSSKSMFKLCVQRGLASQNDNAGKSPRLAAFLSVGVKLVYTARSAEGWSLDMLCKDSALFELPANCRPHVEMDAIVGRRKEEVFRLCWECLGEGQDEILANLIATWAKARTDANKNVRWITAVGNLHGFDHFLVNALLDPFPAGV